ncbi:hypothetical protein Tco_0601935 [Tanacetum coccineum]
MGHLSSPRRLTIPSVQEEMFQYFLFLEFNLDGDFKSGKVVCGEFFCPFLSRINDIKYLERQNSTRAILACKRNFESLMVWFTYAFGKDKIWPGISRKPYTTASNYFSRCSVIVLEPRS